MKEKGRWHVRAQRSRGRDDRPSGLLGRTDVRTLWFGNAAGGKIFPIFAFCFLLSVFSSLEPNQTQSNQENIFFSSSLTG